MITIDLLKDISHTIKTTYESGKPHQVLLQSESVLNGIPFSAESPLVWYESGYLRGGKLATETNYQGFRGQARSDLWFHDGSDLLWSIHLAEPAIVCGVQLPIGSLLQFLKTGEPKQSVLKGNTNFGEWKLTDSTSIWYGNGYISAICCPDPLNYKTRTIPGFMRSHLDPIGDVIGIEVTGKLNWDGFPIHRATVVGINQNAGVHRLILRESFAYESQLYPAGTWLLLENSHVIKTVALSTDLNIESEFDGSVYQATSASGEKISISPDGEVSPFN